MLSAHDSSVFGDVYQWFRSFWLLSRIPGANKLSLDHTPPSDEELQGSQLGPQHRRILSRKHYFVHGLGQWQ